MGTLVCVLSDVNQNVLWSNDLQSRWFASCLADAVKFSQQMGEVATQTTFRKDISSLANNVFQCDWLKTPR